MFRLFAIGAGRVKRVIGTASRLRLGRNRARAETKDMNDSDSKARALIAEHLRERGGGTIQGLVGTQNEYQLTYSDGSTQHVIVRPTADEAVHDDRLSNEINCLTTFLPKSTSAAGPRGRTGRDVGLAMGGSWP